MPSSSLPYVLRVPKRRIELVRTTGRRDARRSRATIKDQGQGVDVISGSCPKLREAPTYADFSTNEDHEPQIASSSSPSPPVEPQSPPDMSLNAEPSVPEEREEQRLPPKSYAEAAEEAISPDSHANGTKEAKAKNIEHLQTNGRIKIPSEEDREQYEGKGQDSSPKSPAKSSHRRKSSLKSNGSIGRKHGEQIDNEVYEKHQDANGKPLTSVKPPDEYEKNTKQSRQPRRRDSQLTPGRQAGAGWHKSKYVYRHIPRIITWLLLPTSSS